MRSLRSISHSASVAALLVGLSSSLAHAQSASAPQAPADDNAVVVTARRTAERAQDIPVAVTALSSTKLATLQINDLGDVARYTPGLRFTDFLDSFNGNVTIRGLQQTNVQNAVGNVGVFLDGVYLQRGYMTDASIGDYDRIEVEKGPQTALFGQNTFGGAVNYITKQPTDDYRGDVRITAGNAGLRTEEVGLGGPIIKGILDARVFYGQSDYDGTWKNNTPGVEGEASHFGAYNRRNFSGALKFTPTDRITITVSDYNLRKHEEIRPFYTIDGTTTETALNCGSEWCGALPSNPAAVRTGVGHPPQGLFTEPQPDTNTYTNVWRVGMAYKLTDDLSLNYTYGGVRGTALEQASFAANSYNPSYTPVVSSQREGGQLVAESHEVRLVYNPSSPLKGEIGYFHSQTNDFFLFGFDSFANPVGQAIKSTGSSPTCTTCTALLFTEQDSKYTTDSGFGRLSYSFLNDRATVSTELRYTNTDISENDMLARKTNPALPLLQTSYGDFTPKFTAQYKLSPNNMLYASAAEGIKAGGFNGYVTGTVALTKAEQSFGEEKNWTYEGGWKASLFDRRLTFAADVFYVDWSNRQISVEPSGYVAAVGTSTQQGVVVPGIYEAAGGATDYGFEINGDYRAFPGLTLDYSLSLQNPTDNKGSQELNVSTYCTGKACPVNGDISGNTIGGVSKVTAAFGGEYRHSFDNLPSWLAFSSYSDMSYFIGAEETYRGMMYTDDLNVTKINPFWLTDAHLGIQRGQIRLSVWVKNLFDHQYVESAFVVPSIKQYNVDFGELRTFGVTLAASF